MTRRGSQRSRHEDPAPRPAQTADFELLANGGFWPLDGFQGRPTGPPWSTTMRLADGRPWPIPITLGSDVGEVGETVALVGHEGDAAGHDHRRRGLRARPAARGAAGLPHDRPGAPGRRGAAVASRRARSPARSPCARCRATPTPSPATCSRRRRPAARSRSAAGGPSSGSRRATRSTARTSTSRRSRWRCVDGLFLHPHRRRDQGRRRRRRDAPALLRGPDRALLPARPRRARAQPGVRCATPARARRSSTRSCAATTAARTSSSGATTPASATTTAPTTRSTIFDEFEPRRARHRAAVLRARVLLHRDRRHGDREDLAGRPGGPGLAVGHRGARAAAAGERPPEEFTRPEVADVLIEAMGRRGPRPRGAGTGNGAVQAARDR